MYHIDVYFSLPSHYITINLGTVIDIDSDFTLTNGVRTNQTLINSDGGSSNSVSTTVTIFDGNGNQVDTIASSVNSASANNVDVLGQQIANSVTNNTQTPINFNGSYDIATNVVTIRADQAGIHDDWIIDINNNGVLAGFQGNITVSNAVSANEIINEIQDNIIPRWNITNNRSPNPTFNRYCIITVCKWSNKLGLIKK